jgi:hypothetical protein
VRAEFLAARAAGDLPLAGEGSYPSTHAPLQSTRTRDEVKAEVLAARQAGQLLPAGEVIPVPNGRGFVVATTPFSRFAELVRGIR